MRVYKPYCHRARPQGYDHDTIFASVEIWVDDLPDAIAFGDIRYVLDGPPDVGGPNFWKEGQCEDSRRAGCTGTEGTSARGAGTG